jgi:signal recognition particle receptor subunit beta
VVMLDTRRIEDCFGVMDYFEDRGTPVVVAINIFEEHTRFGLDEIREALGVGTDVPIVECDARDRESVKNVLVSLIEQVLASRLARELADR